MEEENISAATLESIPGGPELLAWFGYVPSFHDAEIIDLHLNRRGPSTLRIHVWEMTRRIENDRHVLDKEAIVTFTLEGIVALQLEDFSHQNVIFGLELRRVRTDIPSFNMKWLTPPESPPDLYEIVLEPCYGLCGTIRAQKVGISLTPGGPA